jgi:hypothetical protein
VTVVVPPPDPAQVERIVDECLREIEQQRQAEHPGSPPLGPRSAPEQAPPQR